MRQLVAWERKREDLQDLDCTIIAASSDTPEVVRGTAHQYKINYRLGHSVTKAHAETLGAGWNNDTEGTTISGGHIEPTEFILTNYGVVLGSMYASGAIGRMDPDEAVQLIKNREAHRNRNKG